tara:strand:- start:9 stop:287 length:279 start_codon:yes stop_codon:yes gene_type:complete
MAQVTTNIRLLSVEQTAENELFFRFSDNPLVAVYFENMDVFNSAIQQIDQYNELLKKLLILDWSQENIEGKYAVLDCDSVGDIWVKGTMDTP